MTKKKPAKKTSTKNAKKKAVKKMVVKKTAAKMKIEKKSVGTGLYSDGHTPSCPLSEGKLLTKEIAA